MVECSHTIPWTKKKAMYKNLYFFWSTQNSFGRFRPLFLEVFQGEGGGGRAYSTAPPRRPPIGGGKRLCLDRGKEGGGVTRRQYLPPPRRRPNSLGYPLPLPVATFSQDIQRRSHSSHFAFFLMETVGISHCLAKYFCLGRAGRHTCAVREKIRLSPDTVRRRRFMVALSPYLQKSCLYVGGARRQEQKEG